jgi:hypothetical protein
MSHYSDLERACGEALMAALPAGLAGALDEALDLGASEEELLRQLWGLTSGPRARPGGLVYLACEAYLRHKGRQRRALLN